MQDAGKDVAEGTLGVVGRSLIGRCDGQLRFGQGLDVGLTVGCHGHLLELEVGRGHHILRETLRNLSLQGIGCYLTVGGIVGAKVLLVVEFTNEDDYLLQAFYLQHYVLNLTEFDAQSTQLNLMIGTAKNHYIALG